MRSLARLFLRQPGAAESGVELPLAERPEAAPVFMTRMDRGAGGDGRNVMGNAILVYIDPQFAAQLSRRLFVKVIISPNFQVVDVKQGKGAYG